MADLHKFTVQEGINATGPGGNWDVASVSTTGDQAAESNTVHVDVSSAHQLGIYSSGEIYFNFTSTSDTNCSKANDLKLPGDSLIFITVPKGLGNTVFFNHLSTTATAHTVRIVKV